MRAKTVIRYYCDFCQRKTYYSRHHMEKHEKHCTMNPDRECRVCKTLLEQEQPSLKSLVMLLPDPTDYWERNEDGTNNYWDGKKADAVIAQIMPTLRELSGNCPACILAAFRQKGIPLLAVSSHFDFTKEMKEVWAEINEENLANGYY